MREGEASMFTFYIQVNHDSEATLMPTLCYFIILLSRVAW